LAWQPAVNIYVGPDCIEVCMDLAAIRKNEISVPAETVDEVLRAALQAVPRKKVPLPAAKA
jgi:hypothetical protein